MIFRLWLFKLNKVNKVPDLEPSLNETSALVYIYIYSRVRQELMKMLAVECDKLLVAQTAKVSERPLTPLTLEYSALGKLIISRLQTSIRFSIGLIKRPTQIAEARSLLCQHPFPPSTDFPILGFHQVPRINLKTRVPFLPSR